LKVLPVVFLILLMALFAAPARAAEDAGAGKVSVAVPLVLYSGAAALDLATTELALARPGTREANPLGQTTSQRIALKAGLAVALPTLVDLQLQRSGHRGWARALRAFALVGQGAIAVHNLRQRP
jgi:hypothetical protein